LSTPDYVHSPPNTEIVEWLAHCRGWAAGWTTGVRFQGAVGIFLFVTTFIPTLGPMQPPIQWVPGALFRG